MGESVPLLLDSGSMVSLMWQNHFNRYFRLQLGPAEGSVADTHHLFDLTSASGGPRIVGWNLVKLAYQEFPKKYNIDVFEDFVCPDGAILYYFPSCVFITMLMWYQLFVNEIHDED